MHSFGLRWISHTSRFCLERPLGSMQLLRTGQRSLTSGTSGMANFLSRKMIQFFTISQSKDSSLTLNWY